MTFPSFSVGEVLTAADMNAVGLWLVKTQTIASGASQQVTSAFSSGYDHYRITVSNLVVSTNMQIRLTFGAANSGYYYGNPLATMSGGAYDFNTGSNAAFIDLGAVRSASANDFGFDVMAPNNARPTKVSGFGYLNSITFGGLGTGMLNNSTAYTDFTLTASTGTLTSGTIRVYGYRN